MGRGALIAAACIAVVSLLGTWSADAAAGTIAGRITNAAGQPISPCVKVYTAAGSEVSASGAGDGNGSYFFTGLPAGQYKLFMAACSENYASEWYSDKPTLATATPVFVNAAGATIGIDAVLGAGGRILGKVTDRAGRPFANACIRTYGGADDYEQREATTGDSGEYVVEGLRSGSYTVNFRPCDREPVADEYYRGHAGSGAADPVLVRVGQDTTGINGALLPFGRVVGRVTGPGGGPLGGICVNALAPGTRRPDGSAQYDGLDFGMTNSLGQYALNEVSPGAQVVSFGNCSLAVSPYAEQIYRDKSLLQDADLVPVASERTTASIDAQLRLMDDPAFSDTFPALSGVRMVPSRFPPRRRRGRRVTGGAQLRFRSREATTVVIRVERRRLGRRRKGRCRTRARSGRRCRVSRRLRGSRIESVDRGPNRIRFTGHWNGRPLPPGRYRLRITPSAGLLRDVVVGFRIVRRR